ncbi:MAG: hypothetical protein ACJ76F_12585 [Bacteroidia bacterium]
MFETRIKVEKNKVVPILEYKGNTVSCVEVHNRNKDRMYLGISRIRFAFYNTPAREILLDFVRVENVKEITLLPQISNFNLDYNFCRVDNIYGKLLPEEEVFLVCQNVLCLGSV